MKLSRVHFVISLGVHSFPTAFQLPQKLITAFENTLTPAIIAAFTMGLLVEQYTSSQGLESCVRLTTNDHLTFVFIRTQFFQTVCRKNMICLSIYFIYLLFRLCFPLNKKQFVKKAMVWQNVWRFPSRNILIFSLRCSIFLIVTQISSSQTKPLPSFYFSFHTYYNHCDPRSLQRLQWLWVKQAFSKAQTQS